MEPFILKKASHEHGLILISKKILHFKTHFRSRTGSISAGTRFNYAGARGASHGVYGVCVCVCIDPLSIF